MKKVLIFVGAILLLSVPASLLQLRKPAQAHIFQPHGVHYSPENEFVVHLTDDLEANLTSDEKDIINTYELYQPYYLYLLSLEDEDGNPGAPSYETTYGTGETYASIEHPLYCPDPCDAGENFIYNFMSTNSDNVDDEWGVQCIDPWEDLQEIADAYCVMQAWICEWNGGNVTNCQACAATAIQEADAVCGDAIEDPPVTWPCTDPECWDTPGQGFPILGPCPPGWDFGQYPCPWEWTEDRFPIMLD